MHVWIAVCAIFVLAPGVNGEVTDGTSNNELGGLVDTPSPSINGRKDGIIGTGDIGLLPEDANIDDDEDSVPEDANDVYHDKASDAKDEAGKPKTTPPSESEDATNSMLTSLLRLAGSKDKDTASFAKSLAKSLSGLDSTTRANAAVLIDNMAAAAQEARKLDQDDEVMGAGHTRSLRKGKGTKQTDMCARMFSSFEKHDCDVQNFTPLIDPATATCSAITSGSGCIDTPSNCSSVSNLTCMDVPLPSEFSCQKQNITYNFTDPTPVTPESGSDFCLDHCTGASGIDCPGHDVETPAIPQQGCQADGDCDPICFSVKGYAAHYDCAQLCCREGICTSECGVEIPPFSELACENATLDLTSNPNGRNKQDDFCLDLCGDSIDCPVLNQQNPPVPEQGCRVDAHCDPICMDTAGYYDSDKHACVQLCCRESNCTAKC